MRTLVLLLLLAVPAFAADPAIAPVVAKLGSLDRKLTAKPVLLRGHPDGRFASIVTDREQLSTWNLQTGQRVSEEAMALPKHYGLHSESICTDGHRVYAWLNYHGLVRYDIRTKAVKTFVKGPSLPVENGQPIVVSGPQTLLAISADGGTLVAKREIDVPPDNAVNTRLTTWDCKDGELKERYTIELPDGHEIGLSADGKWIGYVTRAPSIKSPTEWTAWEVHLLDARTGNTVRTFGHSEDLFYIDGFSADGGKLLTHGFGQDTSVWNTLSGKRVQSWKYPLGGGPSFFTPDETRVLVDSRGRNVSRFQLLDLKTGRSVREFDASGEQLNLAAFTPDGTALVTANDDYTVRVWDAATGRERFPVIGHAGDVSAVAWLPDGSAVVSGGRDGTIRTWDVASRAEKAVLPAIRPGTNEFLGSVTALAVSPDGRQIAAAAGKNGVRIWDRTANRLADAASADLLPRADPAGDRESWIGQIAFLSNTSLRISDDAFRVVSLSTAAKQNGPMMTMPYRIGKDEDTLLRHSPVIDLRRGLGVMVYFDFYKKQAQDDLRAWDFEKQQFRSGGQWPGRDGMEPVALDPTGRRVVLAERKANGIELIVFLIDPCRELGRFRFPQGSSSGSRPVFSPDGRQCAVQAWVNESEAILIFDMASFSPVAVVTDPNYFHAKAFSPDGRRFAVGWYDSRIFVYDLRGALDPTPPAFDAAACWADLASADAVTAVRAVYRFVDHPTEAAKLFRERLKPAAKPPAVDVAAWLEALDAPAFTDRQAAKKNLLAAADTIEPELAQAVAKNPSPEATQAISAIQVSLAQLRGGKPEGEHRRAYRVVQTLEIIGPPAAEALKAYAAGAKGAFLTQEAEAASGRGRP